jgi:multidrug efflux pump subunit AcrB
MEIMQKLAAETLPDGFAYEWTTLAFQQQRAGNTAVFAFVLAVVFVFLVLAAQFESLTLPIAVILIVPMCLIAAITGVVLRGQDNNILTQVGFIVLIGLAAKNAILIVEFAKQLEDEGRSRMEAAIEAARLRLRPILMTSLAFIFGVLPMVWAVGAGAELRQTLGTTVFSGMIGVTIFGLIFTPVFYVASRWFAEKLRRRPKPAPQAAE